MGITRFAARFTRLSAVLTAGPLRGPGILDLTAMPIDGPVLFSGSWGREWWLGGKRIVHDDGISNEGFDALQKLDDEVVYLSIIYLYIYINIFKHLFLNFFLDSEISCLYFTNFLTTLCSDERFTAHE